MTKKVPSRVKTLSGFMKWAERFNDGQYLFRGVSNHTYEIEASAYRRLPETEKKNPTRLLKINRELIDKARLLGHDRKDGQPLSDLELLAELQHYGAATCLIDFTYSAMVALWFACQQGSKEEANGKVLAVRSDDPVRYKTITPKLLKEKDIDYFFEVDENGRYPLYQWQPKHQNNRVVAQHSVFIFGGTQIAEKEECVIPKNSKQDILISLENVLDITEASVFPDFDGFARLHAHNKLYIEPNVQGYLQRGIITQMEDNLDDAITYYSEVISRQPDAFTLAKAHICRGWAYIQKREYDLAISDFTSGIEEDPNDVLSYYCRGTIYSIKGEYDRAIEDYTSAIQQDPERSEAYVQRAAAYVDKNEIDLAFQDYSTAIKLMPDDPMIYVHQGVAYGRKGDIDKAIEDFTKAIALEPEFVEAYYTRGAAYIDKNEFDLAIDDCTQAIELEPTDARAYCCRGRAYQEKGNSDKAIGDLTQAIELDQEYAEAYLNLGRAYDIKNDLEEAINNYTKAIELKSDDANMYCHRGFAYRHKGDLDKAIDDFTRAIGLDSELAEAYLDRGCIYGEVGDFNKAINDFTELIRLKPNDTEAYYVRGLTYRKKGDFRKAINDFSGAIKVNPDDGNVYYYRGDLQLHLQEWEKAKSDLTDAADRGIDIIARFHQFHGSVVDFEQKIGAQFPDDVAAMLTR